MNRPLVSICAVIGGFVGFFVSFGVYFTWPESPAPIWVNPFLWAAIGATIAAFIVTYALRPRKPKD